MLISAVQQIDSVIHTHIYIHILFHIVFHYGLSQDIEYTSLSYTVGPSCLSSLCIIACICWPQTPNPSLPHLSSPLATTSLFSMPVSLFLFCRKFYLCHILDSTYKRYHMVFVFLLLTSLSMMISSSIHVATNGIISFFFYGWVTFHCPYVPHLLYPSICRWTFRLFPCSGYWE